MDKSYLGQLPTFLLRLVAVHTVHASNKQSLTALAVWCHMICGIRLILQNRFRPESCDQCDRIMRLITELAYWKEKVNFIFNRETSENLWFKTFGVEQQDYWAVQCYKLHRQTIIFQHANSVIPVEENFIMEIPMWMLITADCIYPENI